ncbi:MAG: chemotaxis-specific protein-glutamate methyltransferase CheB [Gemmatimonadaceae bacterium]|nr:chemotaxis-specific protein-glutamate methyltransferase CheB [Gemmatimonadaceae bacterium]
MIRVLVADDSATSRALLSALFSGEADFTVVGEATNGKEAVALAEQLKPDLVTMDLQMPVMDGLEATKQIMVRSPRPIIIVSYSARQREVELSLEATRAGALMALPKPDGPGSPRFASDQKQLVSMARAMAQVKVVRRHGSPLAPASAPRDSYSGTFSTAAPRGRVRLVAIAASTGGPPAIRDILAALPRSFPVPILIVQHIAVGFTSGLAHWLSGDSQMPVKVAETGELAAVGCVYIAPDDRHIGCRLDAEGKIRILLDNSPASGAFRPSASFLFRSVAESLGENALSVILTGMGDDGIAGLRAVKSAGGRVIAQDEATSVIFGMPREAIRAGVVDMVVPLGEIAQRLTEIVR